MLFRVGLIASLSRAGGTIGALIIRIGFWGPHTIIVIRNHQNSIGNYLGPYSRGPSSGLPITSFAVLVLLALRALQLRHETLNPVPLNP